MIGEAEWKKRRFLIDRCRSLEDWQRRLNSTVRALQEEMDGGGGRVGIGRILPSLLGVDSILGKASEQSLEKIFGKISKENPDRRGETGTGYAERNYAIESQFVRKYLQGMPDLIGRYPISVVFVNHLKYTKDDMGNDVRSSPGGDSVKFQQAYELELKRAKGPTFRYDTPLFDGYPVKLSCPVNGFGPAGRSVVVRLIWWYEDDTETGRHTVELTVHSQYRGHRQLIGALAAIKVRLHQVALTLEDGVCVACRVASVTTSRDPDGLTVLGSVEIDLLVETPDT